MTMQESMMNPEISKLDLSKVAALQQKRTLAFVNHFTITTVQFLNSFMKKCEQKLMQFERKLEKVEAAMVLLEARLSSIPDMNSLETAKQDVTDSSSETQPDTHTNTEEQVHDNQDQQAGEQGSSPQTETIEATSPNQDISSSTYPEYEKFVKMVQVGVPLQAVKLKVSLEGLDPSVLEKMLKK